MPDYQARARDIAAKNFAEPNVFFAEALLIGIEEGLPEGWSIKDRGKARDEVMRPDGLIEITIGRRCRS